jgi:hypothetical protein
MTETVPRPKPTKGQASNLAMSQLAETLDRVSLHYQSFS